MFVLRSMRKHPEIFGGRFGNHSRTGAVKLLITRRTSQSSKLLRGTVRRTTACPAAATGLRSSPRSKRMTRPCARVLCSRAVSVGNAGSRCGNLDAGRADVAPPGFSSIAAMYPVLASATARPLAVRSRLGPNVDGVAGRIQRSELLHRVTPAGLSNRARRTPRSWRGLPPRRSPTLGVGAFRRRGRWFPESGLCSHSAVHGPVDPVLPA